MLWDQQHSACISAVGSTAFLSSNCCAFNSKRTAERMQECCVLKRWSGADLCPMPCDFDPAACCHQGRVSSSARRRRRSSRWGNEGQQPPMHHKKNNRNGSGWRVMFAARHGSCGDPYPSSSVTLCALRFATEQHALLPRWSGVTTGTDYHRLLGHRGAGHGATGSLD